MARGLADGSIEIYEVGYLNPVARFTGALGSIRGLAFDDVEGVLVAVTREGEVRIYDESLWSLSTSEMIATLEERLRSAESMGIYQRQFGESPDARG